MLADIHAINMLPASQLLILIINVATLNNNIFYNDKNVLFVNKNILLKDNN